MKSFYLEVLTPEREFLSGEVEELIVETHDGRRGVLSNHTPMIIAIAVGEIRIKQNGEFRSCFSAEGFLEIRPDKMVLMAQSVEWPEEIDVRRAEEAKRRSEEKLRQRQSLQEYHATMSSLARAMARLKLKHSMNID